MAEKTVCKRCFITSDFPNMKFDKDGVCDLCRHHQQDSVQSQLHAGFKLNKLDELKVVAERIKKEAIEKKSKYDCIIGASGGFDSTYVIYIAKKLLGLNPLVVKYDNGVCHPMANDNLKRACKILGVELRIIEVIPAERAYFLNATKALINLGVFFTACFSCHYIIASVVYREAKKEGLKYTLTSTNIIEKSLADSSHSFMLKSLVTRFFSCGPKRMLNAIYYEMIAAWHFARLKFMFDGLSLRFFKNLFSLHPVKPASVTKINVSDYVAWDYKNVENTLRDELGWDTPRKTKVPYFRFDCHYSAMIDKSFKKITGTSEHALLTNWFVQSGLICKDDIAEDFHYMNDDERIKKEMKLVCEKFGLSEDQLSNMLDR